MLNTKERVMKLTLVFGMGISLGSIMSTVAATQPEMSKKQLVEESLALPVYFVGEKAKRYTVEQRMQHHKIPGFSFALINDGKIEWAEGYGMTGDKNSAPVTTDTRFQSASIAKPVTAFAMMRMHQAKDVDLNADVQKYLKTVKLPQGKQTKDNPVTLEKLLAHTAGLTPGGYLGHKQGAKVPTDEQSFFGAGTIHKKKTEVEFEPGTTVKYSGPGYTLAEIAVQDVYQQPFEQIMDTWVLDSVGMNQSSFNPLLPLESKSPVALGHQTDGSQIEGGWHIHPDQAAAGLWSTPTDLAKFAVEMSQAYQGNSKILNQALARKLVSPVFKDQDLSGSFGGQPAITFIVKGEGKDFRFVHGGGNVGYRSYLIMFPEVGKGAVFMANSDAGYGVGMEMLRAVSQVYDWPNFKPDGLTRAAADKKAQNDFLGDYKFSVGWQVSVISSDQADGIAVKFPNGDVYPLTAIEGESEYVHEDTGVKVKFEQVDGSLQVHLYNQIGKKV